MRSALWRRLMALGALLSGVLPTLGQTQSLADSTIQQLIDARVASGFTTGMVVGVLDAAGQRRYFAIGNSGRPDVEMNRQTVFEIGSITKAFTGTLLAQMVEAGEVKLEDAVSRYLPDSVVVPARGDRQITLLDLTTHTSALPRMPTNFAPSNPSNPYADYSVDQMYGFLSEHQLRRDIGSEYEYSNLGAGLLGHALARKAGGSYESTLSARVLEPAGLDDTRVTLTPSMRQRLAGGHDGGGTPVSNWDLPTLAGAGALRSTVEDMLDFLAANMDSTSVLAPAYRLARTPQRPAGPGMQVGLGWHIRQSGERSLVWHNGGTGGYHSFAGFDPVTGAAIVILSNSSSNIDDIGFHLLDPSLPIVASRDVKPLDVAPEVLDRYLGVYELAPTFKITVTREGNALYAQATGQPRFRLFASSPTEFFLRVVEAKVSFDATPDGTVTQLVLHQNGRSTPGRKVE